MSSLDEHFRQSGYTFHQNLMRKERLPRCCQENLHKLDIGIEYLNLNGASIILPVCECRVCGRKFAVSDEKYIYIDNILKFNTINLEQ